jgi:hypothetical protein
MILDFRLEEKERNELSRQQAAEYRQTLDNFPESCHPRMFLSGVQSEFRLDSR